MISFFTTISSCYSAIVLSSSKLLRRIIKFHAYVYQNGKLSTLSGKEESDYGGFESCVELLYLDLRPSIYLDQLRKLPPNIHQRDCSSPTWNLSVATRRASTVKLRFTLPACKGKPFPSETTPTKKTNHAVVPSRSRRARNYHRIRT